MCGIFGVISNYGFNEKRRNRFSHSSRLQSHRGPDDSKEWWSDNFRIGFSHHRLSIVDLSNHGSQPMFSSDKTVVIVFNGEIYNYRDLKRELEIYGYQFKSNSDTEVVVCAYEHWGIDCVQKFNGMFAFSIFDSKKNIVYLVRDRAGEKPLFYSTYNNELCFSSELKALLNFSDVPRKLNFNSFDCYLLMGYVSGGDCMVDDVKKLEPAHILSYEIHSREIKKWRYWVLPEFQSDPNVSSEILIEELSDLLQDSVKIQLLADVDVGVLLSGGVDSSLITAMAARTGNRIKTFNVKFSGSDRYDESSYARFIADHFKTDHIELEANSANVELLPFFAKQFDEPMADSSMIPTFLVSKLIKEHCTVALGGDGGDELFGGYLSYDLLLKVQKEVKYIPLELRKFVAASSLKYLPIGFKGRNYLNYWGTDFSKDLPLFSSLFDKVTRRKLIPFVSGFCAEDLWKNMIATDSDIIQRITRTDFNNYLANDILVKVDRASMLNSLEIRAPFLDYRIIEFAFGKVPSNQKVTLGERKILLKRLCRQILPSGFDFKRKQGFSVPLSNWVSKGPWRDYLFSILTDKTCIFDKSQILSLFDGHGQVRNNSERIFALALFQLWYDEYKISI